MKKEKIAILSSSIFLSSCAALMSAQELYDKAKEKNAAFVLNTAENEKEQQYTDEWAKYLERPTPVYNSETLGFYLQELYKQHHDACIELPLPKGKNFDFVPSQIRRYGQNIILLDEKVTRIDSSMGNLMLYLFDDAEKQKFQATSSFKVLPENILGKNYNDFELSLQSKLYKSHQGSDSVLAKQSCSNYLLSFMSANVRPPYAALKASLNTSDEKRSSIVLMNGFFQSSLSNVFNGSFSNMATKNYLYLWDTYYQRSKSNKSLSLKRLSFIKASLLKRITDQNKTIKLEGSLDAAIQNGAIPPLDLNVVMKLNGNMEFGEAYNFLDFETFLYNNEKNDNSFVDAPSIDDIQKYFKASSLNPDFVNINAPKPLKGLSHKHVVQIKGLTQELCIQQWFPGNVTGEVYATGPKIIKYSYDPKQETCEFQIEGTFKDAFFDSPNAGSTVQPKEIKYNLVNVKQLKLSPTMKLDDKLKLTISMMVYPNDIPFQLMPQNTQYSKANDGTHTWQIDLRVNKGETQIDSEREITVRDFKDSTGKYEFKGFVDRNAGVLLKVISNSLEIDGSPRVVIPIDVPVKGYQQDYTYNLSMTLPFSKPSPLSPSPSPVAVNSIEPGTLGN